ncbi:MAG: pyruvate kinase [Bacteroidetes bacterium]|nr:pyruvate kinase [Bacteroidota bacterium]
MATKNRSGRTKIICTIGPSTEAIDQIVQLIDAGMDVARLNFSHGTHDLHEKMIKNVREASKQRNEHIALLQDLCGPKIRTGRLKKSPITLTPNSEITFTIEDILGDENCLTTTYKQLPHDVQAGDVILLDDGKLRVEVISTTMTEVRCRVRVGGLLGENKGMNLPGVKLSTPSLTEKDLEDLEFGVQHGIDYVALSFVRSADDIRLLRAHLQKIAEYYIPIIAKIEMREAILAIDEIIAESDAIMVARGDLGVEMPAEEVPMLQKMIVRKCNEQGKPVIIATQMLETMIENPRPTRAEASDIANAVLDGADAVMLSGETSVGKYPIEAVRMMDTIIRTTEEYIFTKRKEYRCSLNTGNVLDAIAQSACLLAEHVNAAAIIPITHSGGTARRISRFRPSSKIIAVTGETRVLRRLNLVWGVQGIVISDYIGNADATLQRVKEQLKAQGFIKSGDYIVFTMGIPLMARGMTDTINVERVE